MVQPQQFLLIIFIMVVVLAWYSNFRLRNMVLCEYTRVNGQVLEKFVPMRSRYIIFDNKRFIILPHCKRLFWYDRGLINKIFPTWVIKYGFVHSSEYPIDPDTGQTSVLTPEVRNVIDKEETMKSFMKHATPQGSRKEGLIQHYGIYIVIFAVIIVGFMWYQDHQQIAAILNYLKVTGR